jgi:HlyD family secretion protein
MTRHPRPLSLGALAVALVTVLAGCGDEPPAPTTATVQRGDVATMVSASGALASITTQNLGFPKGAQLKELNVKVGDTVRPGQVLARLDSFAFQQMLNQQQAQLQNQQAQLNRLLNGNTVEQAQRSLDQAEEIVSATRRNVEAQLRLDRTNVERAEVALNNAERQKNQAERNLDYCRSQPASTPRALGGAAGRSGGGGAGGFGALGMPGGDDDRDRDGVLGGNDGTYSEDEGGADPCTQQVSALNQARTAQVQARTTLEQARKQKKVNETQGQLSIENAQQSLITARNNRDTAGSDTPANIEAQRALVANAAAAVALARRDLDNTVLFAPMAGTVAVINGAVGEFLGAQSGTTSLAPGTTAAIPGVGASAITGETIVSADGNRNGGTFITLSNVDTYQVVVPFEESDAAKVAPNQEVEVSFDAVPDLTRRGRVLSVAPSGTDISGVTNYYATIVLTEGDPRLRDGQTAEASVLTTSRNNVLTVPNNAVTNIGGRSFVTTPGPDGQPVQTPFQPGLVGDDRTEVLSGLSEGQQILLPQATVTATPGGGRGGPGGRGN